DLTDVEPTRPEELDEVFRKKDRNIQKEEEQPATTVSFNENTKKTASTKAAVRKRLEKKAEQETPSKPLNNDTNDTVEETPDMEKEQQPVPDFSSHELDEAKRIIEEPPQTLEKPESEQQAVIPNHLLNDPTAPEEDDADWLIEQQILLEDTLEHFHIKATVEK